MDEFFEDIELLNEAMENAYLFVTKKVTVDNIYDRYLNDGSFQRFALPFDPTTEDGRTTVILDMLIEHFTETEEYEKCAELVKIKKTLKD
jgi:hypothetical protein